MVESEINPADHPEILVGPMLLMLRRMEKLELVIDRLMKQGVVTQDILDWAVLKSTLNHAERVMRVRKRTKRPFDDVKRAADEVRKELASIEQRIQLAV
jgi:hypothetical protein